MADLLQVTRDSNCELKDRMETLKERLGSLTLDNDERKLWEDERGSILQSLDICSRATEAAELKETISFEDVQAGQYSQLVVNSIYNGSITAKNVTTAVGANLMLRQTPGKVMVQLAKIQREVSLKKLEGQQAQPNGEEAKELEETPRIAKYADGLYDD